MDRPIPAFYCCYLLRSTVRHQSLYVGSTPNPLRRLRQHNGDTKGGAARTSRLSLRPWEMTCIVAGFPSKISALQFEWAWQNTHLTRHIAAEERITRMNTKSRISPRSGRKITRVTRPRMSMTDRLINLHILLCAQSFRRWPLQVRFFCADVFKMWQRLASQRDGLCLRPEDVQLDCVNSESDPQQSHEGQQEQLTSRIAALDATYQQYKAGLQHSLQILSQEALSCHSCKSPLDKLSDLVLICPHTSCGSTFHLSCLSNHFIGPQTSHLLPTHHTCPNCEKPLVWSDMVKDLSLRARGVKEQADLFKEKGRKKRAGDAGETAAELIESLSANEDEDVADIEVTARPATARRARKLKASSQVDTDDWHDIEEKIAVEEPMPLDERAMITASPGIAMGTVSDSDWDEAEVLA